MDHDGLLRRLVAAEDGHFLLESGHHGPLWLDLDALFLRPDLVRPLTDALANRLRRHDVEVVCGPFTGGALIAFAVASALAARFVAAERVAHQPGSLFSAGYRVPAGLCTELAGRRVAVVDDVVNAGSATRSVVAAVRAANGIPVVIGALLRLGEAVAEYAAAEGLAAESLAAWPSRIWEPGSCPRCAAGEPLTDRA